VSFEVVCSTGTYVRSLCAEMGERLGCGACLATLRRTRSGLFAETAALSLAGLDGEDARQRILDRLLPLTEVLAGVPAITVGEVEARRIREGVQPSAALFRGYDSAFLVVGDMVTFVRENRVLVAIAEMLYGSGQLDSLDSKAQAVKILRVFNQ
jgi:tRNA pseudouridine55 synthase